MYKKKRHPIVYFLRKITPLELNYDIYDKELLAIVATLKHWRIYAESIPNLTIYSDYKNLTTFTTTKQLNRRQVRWSEELGQYKFKVIFTPGKENGRADALSRRTDYLEAMKSVEHSILKYNKDGTLSANQIIAPEEMELHALETYTYKEEVPENRIEQIIKEHHDDLLRGHPGIAKTIKLIRRRYTFPKMKERITEYIEKCDKCQKNKTKHHPDHGLIQFREPPDMPWQEVTMDMIVKLPKSKDTAIGVIYDSILVVVDRLTKYAYYILYYEIYSLPELVQLFIDCIIRHYRFPKVTIIDRGRVFTLVYWDTFLGELGIKGKKSIAFYL